MSTHYGQGIASQTPYLNYWVVSIYYLPSTGEIVTEKNRYPGLKEMKMDYHYAQIGMKKDDLAIFYSTSKNTLNYSERYENFMKVCKEAIRVYPNKE